MGTQKFTRNSPWDPERKRRENEDRRRRRSAYLSALALGVIYKSSGNTGYTEPPIDPGEELTLDSALTPPVIALTVDDSTWPITLTFDFDPSTLTTDLCRLTLLDATDDSVVFQKSVVVGTGPLDYSASAPELDAILSGTHKITARIENATHYGPESNELEHGPNVTAPILSAFTATAITATTATVGVTTDWPDGTLYHLRNTSATPVAPATIVSTGTAQVITSAGAKTFNLTGLTSSTTYYDHFAHAPAVGPTSAELIGSFTTDAMAAFSLTETAAPADANVNYDSAFATFTAQPIGAADSSRRVLVAVTLFDTSGTFPQSVTVGGVAATKLVSEAVTSIWSAAVPTGTTADVVVSSFNGATTIDSCAIKVFRLVGANPTPTESVVTATSFVGDPTIAVTTPSGGGSLIYGWTESLGSTATMVNATVTTSGSTKYWAHAGGIRTTAGAATVTVDWSSGFNNKNVLALSFGV